jgi:hypothetical protein
MKNGMAYLPEAAEKRDAADAAIEGAASAPLSNAQKTRLVLAAKRAYGAQVVLGLADEGEFDAWRKAALWDAVRRSSFRQLDQRGYGRAMAHYLRLAGVPDKPRAWARAARDESGEEGDARRARHILAETEEALAGDFAGGARGVAAYAAALFGRIHRTTEAAATARQVWAVIFTLRSRAKRRSRIASAASAPDPSVDASGALEAKTGAFPTSGKTNQATAARKEAE